MITTRRIRREHSRPRPACELPVGIVACALLAAVGCGDDDAGSAAATTAGAGGATTTATTTAATNSGGGGVGGAGVGGAGSGGEPQPECNITTVCGNDGVEPTAAGPAFAAIIGSYTGEAGIICGNNEATSAQFAPGNPYGLEIADGSISLSGGSETWTYAHSGGMCDLACESANGALHILGCDDSQPVSFVRVSDDADGIFPFQLQDDETTACQFINVTAN